MKVNRSGIAVWLLTGLTCLLLSEHAFGSQNAIGSEEDQQSALYDAVNDLLSAADSTSKNGAAEDLSAQISTVRQACGSDVGMACLMLAVLYYQDRVRRISN